MRNFTEYEERKNKRNRFRRRISTPFINVGGYCLLIGFLAYIAPIIKIELPTLFGYSITKICLYIGIPAFIVTLILSTSTASAEENEQDEDYVKNNPHLEFEKNYMGHYNRDSEGRRIIVEKNPSWFITPNAKILFIIGSILLFLSFTGSTKNIFVGGFELSQICRYLGIGLLLIGKMPQLLLLVVFLYIAYVLAASGQTSSGFQWGAVSTKAWLIAMACSIVFYILKKVFVIGKS